jgi:hypothetical protein
MTGCRRIGDETTADGAAMCTTDPINAVAEILKRTLVLCHDVSLSTSLDRTAAADEHVFCDSGTPRVGDLRDQVDPNQL